MTLQDTAFAFVDIETTGGNIEMIKIPERGGREKLHRAFAMAD